MVAGYGRFNDQMEGCYSSEPDPDNQPCNCIGRQWVNGELQPGCPCCMRKQHKGLQAMKLFGADLEEAKGL